MCYFHFHIFCCVSRARSSVTENFCKNTRSGCVTNNTASALQRDEASCIQSDQVLRGVGIYYAGEGSSDGDSCDVGFQAVQHQQWTAGCERDLPSHSHPVQQGREYCLRQADRKHAEVEQDTVWG